MGPHFVGTIYSTAAVNGLIIMRPNCTQNFRHIALGILKIVR